MMRDFSRVEGKQQNRARALNKVLSKNIFTPVQLDSAAMFSELQYESITCFVGVLGFSFPKRT